LRLVHDRIPRCPCSGASPRLSECRLQRYSSDADGFEWPTQGSSGPPARLVLVRPHRGPSRDARRLLEARLREMQESVSARYELGVLEDALKEKLRHGPSFACAEDGDGVQVLTLIGDSHGPMSHTSSASVAVFVASAASASQPAGGRWRNTTRTTQPRAMWGVRVAATALGFAD
jgi:hypothetical protein